LELVEALYPMLMNKMIQMGNNRCTLKLESMEERNGDYYVVIHTEYTLHVSLGPTPGFVIVCPDKNIKLCGDNNGYAIWRSPMPTMDCNFKLENYQTVLKLDSIDGEEVQVVLFPNHIMSAIELKRFCARNGGQFQCLRDYDSCRKELRMLFSRSRW